MPAFAKDPAFIYRQRQPPNGGPPAGLMRREAITPLALFYVRNHGPTPHVDESDYRLRIQGLVARPLSLSIERLREGFPARTVTATLQCAGNRREDIIRVAPIPGEVPFGGEAISTAVWTGVPLAEVLAAAGCAAHAAHVEFIGSDKAEKEGKTYEFGGSITLEKALAPDTLLAYEMNGEPLPTIHGFPLRAIVPGFIGARSVKWLREINVRAEPSTNQFMIKQYRLYPASATKETVHPGDGTPLMEVPVNSYICRVSAGGTGGTLVEGWAFVGGDRTITRVEISADNGAHWAQAEFLPDGGADLRWRWRFWRAELLQSALSEIVARAWDSGANTQPELPDHVWNHKGYANNAWHRWRADPEPSDAAEPVQEIEYYV